MRGVLEVLAEAGLVESRVGRMGSRLTPRGTLFMNWLVNRSTD